MKDPDMREPNVTIRTYPCTIRNCRRCGNRERIVFRNGHRPRLPIHLSDYLAFATSADFPVE